MNVEYKSYVDAELSDEATVAHAYKVLQNSIRELYSFRLAHLRQLIRLGGYPIKYNPWIAPEDGPDKVVWILKAQMIEMLGYIQRSGNGGDNLPVEFDYTNAKIAFEIYEASASREFPQRPKMTWDGVDEKVHNIFLDIADGLMIKFRE